MKKEGLNPVLLVALLGLFTVGCSPVFQSVPESSDLDLESVRQAPQATPYVLPWHEGELLYDSQGRTTSITVSPEMGSTDYAGRESRD